MITNQIVTKIREELKPLYSEIVKLTIEGETCTFALQWGSNFQFDQKAGLLFVGKAVNGWINQEKNIDILFSTSHKQRIFNLKNQLKWVNEDWGNKNGYNTKKSAFWSLLKKVTQEYHT